VTSGIATWRQLALRLLGSCAGLAIVAIAAQLLAISLGTQALLGQGDVDATVDWIRRSHGDGAEVLVGAALVALAVWFTWAFVSTLRTRRPVVVTRRESGWTRIDRRTLAGSLERSIGLVVPRARIAVRVRRKGRVDVTIFTRDPDSAHYVEESLAELERLITERGLPCTVGRVEARLPRGKHASRVR
jgi:hypothetical protein